MPLGDLGGHSGYWRVFEGGPRDVLAIHCSLAHSGAWAGLAGQLQDAATITAYDLPMHGRSCDWDGQSDLHDIATEMGAALLTHRMDLFGHSFGATVALRLATLYPDRVRSLTLIEPVFFAAAEAVDPDAYGAYVAAFGPLFSGLDTERETVTRNFVRAWGDGRRWFDLPDQTRSYLCDRITFIPATNDSLSFDTHRLLAPGVIERVTMPALLVQGAAAHPIMDVICEALARRMPDATRVTIPGAGHMAPITHSEPVAHAVRALFLRAP